MEKIGRRGFLRGVGGAAVAVVGFLYPGVADSLGRTTRGPAASAADVPSRPSVKVERMDGPDPSYAGGEVVEKVGEGLVLKADTGVRAVRIPSDTVVWKEFDVTPDAIGLGDWVDVKGTPLADGSLLARSGWVFVNIGRYEGALEAVSGRGLTLRTDSGLRTIQLSSRLEVIRADDGRAVAGGIAALRPGTRLGAVGLRLPEGGFRATRIWTA
jgi:hypothetical protein